MATHGGAGEEVISLGQEVTEVDSVSSPNSQLTQASMEAHWDEQCPTTDAVNSERESTRGGGVSESIQVDQTAGMVTEGTTI